MSTATATSPLSHRHLALLRATEAGRVVLSWSSEPDAFVDGLSFCDQQVAHELVHSGLVEPVHAATVGQQVAARITVCGRWAVADRDRPAWIANAT
jgi:hypothetical protein